MSDKVTLVYENGEYTVSINDKIVNVNKYMDNAIESFTQVITDNAVVKGIAWDNILKDLEDVKDNKLEINNDYNTLTFGAIKYFYRTDKVFDTRNGEMYQLLGGYHLFSFIVKMTCAGFIKNYEEVLDFLKEVLERKVVYRTSETSIIVTSPAFNYGSAEYNFISGKINRGATIEKMSFDLYKKYVLNTIK